MSITNNELLMPDETIQGAYEQIAHYIQKASTIIIHRHINPDPDALGAQLGLAQAIKDNFNYKQVYCVGNDLPSLQWIGQMDDIVDDDYQDALVIIVDTANSARIDDGRYLNGKNIIKIDHHPIVEQYGMLNVVDVTASSVSEMIAQFIFSQNWKMTKEVARLLYIGIVGDTGRFLFSNATQKTMGVVTALRAYPFSATDINQKMVTKSIQEARLCGYILQYLTEEDGVAYVILNAELLQQYHISKDETSSVVGLPGTIENILCWAIAIQNEDSTYRVRLRSKGPIINTIAMNFDGGGHPLASGANAKDEADVLKIVNLLKEAVLNYRKEECNGR